MSYDVYKMMCYMYLCYSIHMAHNSPDMTGEVDVITNAEVSTFLSGCLTRKISCHKNSCCLFWADPEGGQGVHTTPSRKLQVAISSPYYNT